MGNEKISESKESNYFIKERGIPKGCQQCLKGQKSVLFLNGICQKPDQCSWYCPISEERRGKDISFINEIKIEKKSDILKELKKSGSKGMSITGGEPLIGKNIKKTIEYIHLVKTQFNEKFHIHLYTNGINFNQCVCVCVCFQRNRAILNRDVRHCHPPGSAHIVDKILEDFK
ncbi:MAG: radical SAM protein, partial [Promethearchaeati archaeon]